MKTANTVIVVGLLAFAGLGSAVAQGTDEGRFKRIHFRAGTPLVASGIASTLSGNLRSWSFGDDRMDWALFWTITTHYPRVSSQGRYDLQLEYAITRKFALGLAIFSLGNASGKGYDRLGVNADGVSFGNSLHANVRATAYFLSASYMPPPKSGQRFSPRVGLGVGLSDIEVALETDMESKVLEGKPLCGLAFAGLDYWPFRSLSFGLTLQYRYVPFKSGASGIRAEDMDLNTGQMTVVTYQIPGSKYSLDGAALGICVGLHF